MKMILLQQGFLKSLKSEGKAAGTLAVTRGWLEHFEDFCLREGVTEPTPDDLSRYHQELLWRPGPGGRLYAPNTVNQAIGAIRSFLRWAHHSGFLQRDVGAHLRMRHVARSRRVLTTAERRRLLELPDPRTPLGTRDGGRMKPVTVGRVLKTYAEAADVPMP
ncbi:MAG: phage integrase N-terminal SAM-like domain-containing protein [Candidatus Eremiobacteraeota bacterium]|nr:phage integrase N-terminal SAM-like domain-containing protein [Candidatus Eremiobacteraeota bacterium]